MGPGISYTHSVDNYGAVFTSHNCQSAVLYCKGRSAPLNPKQVDLLKANLRPDYDISVSVTKILSTYDEQNNLQLKLKEKETALATEATKTAVAKAELMAAQTKLKEADATKAELASMRLLLHSKTKELTEAHAAHSKEIAELNSRVRTTAELLESMSSELARLQLCEEELIRLKQIEARQLREAAFEREMVERRVGVWKNSTATNVTNATNATNATTTTVEAHDDPK
jgi:chromosome segregation ATPase